MTGAVSNGKRRAAFGTVYWMERIVGARRLGINAAFTERELEYGRGWVAYRLRRARQALRRACNEQGAPDGRD